MTRHRVSFAAWLMCCLVLCGASQTLAQTPAPTNAPAPAAAQPAADDPVGNVATLTGSATVTRNNASTPLKLKDDIFLNDVLQTSANSTLGVTFNDATTFNLTANARIAVDSFVYEDGGKKNAALFNVAKGTVAFVAAAVAKTGDMTISTPTATLGIRGTTGLVEVPEGTSAGGANNVAVKLYPDPDGKVGRIEINDRAGARLGFLTQGASGFTIRPTVGGGRFAAVPLLISPEQALRDQGFVRQVHAAQNFGRQIVTQRQIQRRQNPSARPGLQRQNGRPQQPGLQRQPGLQPGTPPRPGQPGLPRQPGQPGLQRQPGAPGLQRPAGQIRPGLPRRPAAAAPRQKPPPQQR
ncbi:MAG TPA: FecR domain-containing protein [Bradyrhizobium sp.]|nr:FecR domain-containing protein [Bradyrhizobium sp.]